VSKTILVVPDQHAHPDYNNDRADLLAKTIIDLQPDIVVNIGDGADMTSLASYDKGKRSFHGKSYDKDVKAHLDFQSRMWDPVKARKKRLPDRYYFIGNHEQRIDRALDMAPELEGTIGYKDLELRQYYDEVIDYEGGTPGVKVIEGVAFAHYFITGIMGRPISGEHPAYSLITKNFQSCVQGHTHVLDFCERTTADRRKVMSVVCGVYQDYEAPWAGNVNDLWWRGLVILHNTDGGQFDLETVSLQRLKKVYGG
jgi:hypothetical protein